MKWGNQDSVGPWTVKTKILPTSEEVEGLLKVKAVKDVQRVLTGKIEYYIEVLETEDGERPPLVFIENFTKETRPPCWKNADLRVEATLPILGVDKTYIYGNSASCRTRCVKVSLSLDNI